MLATGNRSERLRRTGAVMPFVLLSLAVIVGILALGMDGGRLMDERRRAQATADAAALAAAADLYENYWRERGKDPSGTAAAAAVKLAAANGYANDGITSFVTVNIPPKSGAFAGKATFVEVEVEYRLSRSFAAVFTGGDLTIKARAVAVGRPAKIGLLLLRPNGADAFLNQSLAFAVLGNPIVVNANDPAAFNHNSIGPVVASRYDVTGNYVNSGGGLILGRMRTGVPPTADPLRKLPEPNPAAYPIKSAKPLVVNALIPTVLTPGVYQGGIQITGASIVTMQPGVYVMDGGGFKIDGLATLAGVDVMIFNTDGTFPAGAVDINTLGKVVLTAPVTGSYQGIGIFQKRSLNQTLSLTGYGSAGIAGMVYAAGAPVNLTGALAIGLDTLGGAHICSSMQVSGAGSINIDIGTNPPRVPDVTLVE